MEIMKRLKDARMRVLDGDTTYANDLAEAGLAAVFAGIRKPNGDVTTEWTTLMSLFTTDQTELDRLCGKDTDFNGEDWGPMSLVYIAGNSTCTSETTVGTGPYRAMNDQMKLVLDKDF